MTKLKPGQSIKRLVRVFGIDQPVSVEMTADGLSLWVSPSRKRITIGWLGIASASNTPLDVPSFLAGRPIDLLKHQAARK